MSCVSRFETSLAVFSQWYLINCFCVSFCEWTTPFSFSDILNVTTPRSSALHAENGRTVPVLHSTSYPHQRPRSSLRQRSRKGTFHTLSCCVCVCVCRISKTFETDVLLVNMKFVSTENSVGLGLFSFCKKKRPTSFLRFLVFHNGINQPIPNVTVAKTKQTCSSSR